MAGILRSATTTKIALTASTNLAILQVAAPTNQRVKILRWGVFFDEETGDATPADPLYVTVGRQTSTGGTSLAASNIAELTPGITETLQSTLLSSVTSSALDILDTAMVNAQTGYEVIFPMGQEIVLGGGEKFGIEILPTANISTGGLNAVAKIWFEE